MNFKETVQTTPGLTSAYEPGLQALKAGDRQRIGVTDTRCLCGSVDLDRALRNGPRANEPVWDYGVCHHSGNEKVHWVEVHPASGHGVTEVLAKLAWLKAWLSGDGRRLRSLPTAFVWVSSGKTTFTKSSPLTKKLAAQGLITAGGHYLIR